MMLSVAVILTAWSFCYAAYLTEPNGNDHLITVDVSLNHSMEFSITSNSSVIIEARGFSDDVTSIIFGVHSWYDNITLSQGIPAVYSNSVTGKNVGLTFEIDEGEPSARMWIINANPHNVSLFLYLSLHNAEDPVPGGCNMEFPVEISPYLLLFDDKMNTMIEFQHANIGYSTSKRVPSCDQAISYIGYDIFVLHLEENNYIQAEYFNGIKKMSEAKTIRAHAKLVKNSVLHPETRIVFLKYPRVGAIFNVIAKYSHNGVWKEAAYVPTSTYGCLLSSDGLKCGFPFSSATEPFLIITSVVGFFIAFFGHRYFTVEMLFFGFFSSLFIGFVLISKYGKSSSDQTVLLYSVIVAVFGGMIYALVWLCLQRPVISVIPVGFFSGLLLSAVLLVTPLGDFEIFMNNKVYWMFVCGVSLLTAIITTMFPKMMNIIGSSFTGSYLAVLIIDYLLRSNLMYIIINVIKRALTSSTVFIAVNAFPFGNSDKIVCAIWTCLFIGSSTFQAYINCKRPKFLRLCESFLRAICYFCSVSSKFVRFRCKKCIEENQQEDATQPLLTEERPDYQTFVVQ